MKVFLALTCIVASLGSLRAQTNHFTVGWFYPNSYSASASVATNYTGVAMSELLTPVVATRGPGLGAWSDGPARTWGFSLPVYPSFEQAIESGAYIEFTLTPASGFMTQLGYLYFPASVFSESLSVGLFSSATGFDTQHQLGETFVVSSTNSAAPDFVQFNNSSGPFYGSSTTYRLYFTSAESNHFFLGNSSHVGWTSNEHGMTIIGFSAPAVPEPSAFGFLCGVGAFWFATVVLTVSRKRQARAASR